MFCACRHTVYAHKWLEGQCFQLGCDCQKFEPAAEPGAHYLAEVQEVEPGTPTCDICGALMTHNGPVWTCLSCGACLKCLAAEPAAPAKEPYDIQGISNDLPLHQDGNGRILGISKSLSSAPLENVPAESIEEMTDDACDDLAYFPQPAPAVPKCPRCGSIDKAERKEVYSDSSYYDFTECGDPWHRATQPAPAVSPDYEQAATQLSEVNAELRNEIAALRAQLEAKTAECEQLYTADKQTQEILGKYMKDAEDAKAQLAEAERKYAELKDGYRLRVEDIDDLMEKLEQAERK